MMTTATCVDTEEMELPSIKVRDNATICAKKIGTYVFFAIHAERIHEARFAVSDLTKTLKDYQRQRISGVIPLKADGKTFRLTTQELTKILQ